MSFACNQCYTLIVCLYAAIAFGDKVPPSRLGVYVLGIVNGLCVILICYGVFGNVYEQSQKVLETIVCSLLPKSMQNTSNIKWTRRYAKSLPVLKIRFGQVNFVARSTGFVLIDFCVSQVVSLLLMDWAVAQVGRVYNVITHSTLSSTFQEVWNITMPYTSFQYPQAFASCVSGCCHASATLVRKNTPHLYGNL